MAWPDGGDNPTVNSVGATARDYETITAWEAATDVDVTAAGTNSSPVGDCYDDADFSENVLISSDPAYSDSAHYRTLTVHTGERHGGKEGAGATIISSSSNYPQISRETFCVLEWLILAGTHGVNGISYTGPKNCRHMFRNLMVINSGASGLYALSLGSGGEVHAWNCVVHGPTNYCIYNINYVVNCSVLGGWSGVAGSECYNIISIGASTDCFSSCTGDYNISGDATAPDDGAGKSHINIDKDDIYTNTGAGTEDLHLKSDVTAAHGAGSDCSVSFTIDIDGETRVLWDIGADERLLAGGGWTIDRGFMRGEKRGIMRGVA